MSSRLVRLAIAFASVVCACATKQPKAGDVCAAADEGTLVCTSTTSALLCKGERRVARTCRGPKGCVTDRATCDRSIGREGDACSERNVGYYDAWDAVCSEKADALLACRDGKLAVDTPCRGPKGCSGGGQSVSKTTCDQTLGEVGDACNRHHTTSHDLGACSVDKKTSLACDRDDEQSGKLVVKKTCGAKACTIGHVGGDPLIPIPVCDD